MGAGKLRIDVERFSKMSHPLQQLSVLCQRGAKIVVHLGKIRHEIESLLIVTDGLPQPSRSGESVAEIVMGLGVGWLDLQSLLILGNCSLGSASLIKH